MTSVRFSHLKVAFQRRGNESNIKENLLTLLQMRRILYIFKENANSIFNSLLGFLRLRLRYRELGQ